MLAAIVCSFMFGNAGARRVAGDAIGSIVLWLLLLIGIISLGSRLDATCKLWAIGAVVLLGLAGLLVGRTLLERDAPTDLSRRSRSKPATPLTRVAPGTATKVPTDVARARAVWQRYREQLESCLSFHEIDQIEGMLRAGYDQQLEWQYRTLIRRGPGPHGPA